MGNHFQSEFLSAWTDGAMSDAQREKIAQHVQECVDCRSALHDLERVQWTIQQLPPKKMPVNFALNLRVMASEKFARNVWTRLGRWAPTVGLLGLLALTFWLQLINPSKESLSGKAISRYKNFSTFFSPNLNTPSLSNAMDAQTQ